MINTDFLLKAAEVGADAPTLFPFPFSLHIGFCIISLAFFLFRFLTDKRLYQAIMGIAIPLSLILWVSDNKTLYYAIGIVEAVLVIVAFVSSIFDGKSAENTAEEAAGEATEKSEDEE